MRASKNRSLSDISYRRGFTIVELLIVIVVIGILAAIVIVAYNGVQQRARVASLQSDLVNVSKKMAIDNINNGAYAATASAVDGGNGLPASNGTTYQYHSTGTSYCITGTNGNVSYNISDTSTNPSQGGCPGDGVGGVVAIVNLITNPSFESNTSGWSGVNGTAITRITSGVGIVSGSAALEANIATANQDGIQLNYSGLSANTKYTFSGSVTLVSGDPTALILRAGDGSGTRATTPISGSLIAGQPVHVSLTWLSSPTNPTGAFQVFRNGTSPGTATIRIDAAMITAGTTSYSYADGNSPNWLWNGSPNNSTSTGPAS